MRVTDWSMKVRNSYFLRFKTQISIKPFNELSFPYNMILYSVNATLIVFPLIKILYVMNVH